MLSGKPSATASHSSVGRQHGYSYTATEFRPNQREEHTAPQLRGQSVEKATGIVTFARFLAALIGLDCFESSSSSGVKRSVARAGL
jgi:hypothetical protein